jgi:Recombinase zinc beta ribbon domain
LGDPSKYLLTNLALCGQCHGPLHVRSQSHGTGRKYFYTCSGYHLRGRTVCANGADAPMDDTNDVLIEALLDARGVAQQCRLRFTASRERPVRLDEGRVLKIERRR